MMAGWLWSHPRQNGKSLSVQFGDTLPRGPLVAHLMHVHQIALFLADGGSPENAMPVLERSLREIAVFTQENERYPRR